jgi:2-polyprenyl-6-methoxyphenol hydroxylase-like FAD-dependent oxidoreductase
MSSDMPRYDHAVVLGASMAGLVTAQALTSQFRHVTIIERDELPESPAARPGVPQGRHLHALLPGGLAALDRLFERYGDGLGAAGALPLGVPEDLAWLNPAGWVPRARARHRLLSASRDLIEWYTRTRLMESAAVTIHGGIQVCGLVSSADGRGVVGVELRAAGGDGAPTTLGADLVVDATGRRSKAADWLDALGYARPEETRIDAGLAYTTREYRRTDGDFENLGWKAAFVQARPGGNGRMGIVFPIEHDRWIVTLQGVGGDAPPTTADGFLDFAGSLPSRVIHDAIRGAEPLAPAVAFANTANRRRHYERLARWPERFVVVGDSACAFNPVYGQGMSVAAQTAVAFSARLAHHALAHQDLDGFARPMQRVVARCGRAAWMIATGDDLRLPTTRGATANIAMRMQHRYLDRVLAAATRDVTVLDAMTDVFFLLARPESLFRPSIVARVMRSARADSTDGTDLAERAVALSAAR